MTSERMGWAMDRFSSEQVEDNASASGIELDDATLSAIDEAVADGVVYDSALV